jgi:phosphatidylserine/phosphatidylglycerophosphate/cardiolipin synthase-like enzyme
MRTTFYFFFLFTLLPQTGLRAEPKSFLERLFAAPSPRGSSQAQPSRQGATAPGTIPMPETFFSPRGGCTQAVVNELKNARQSILVQAYSFTSAPIAGALVEAARRGVLVEVVLDKSNKTGKYSSADFVAHAGIPTWIDDRHAIAHNKVIIIDEANVITGSFNFTKAAEESNAENLLILRSSELASRYTQQFLEHRRHSVSYAGR